MTAIRTPFVYTATSMFLSASLFAAAGENLTTGPVKWRHPSSTRGDLPAPDVGRQVAALILDVDGASISGSTRVGARDRSKR